jgi:hypothetical protein
LRSSKISFTAETVITNIRGNKIVGWPFVIEIDGIVYKEGKGVLQRYNGKVSLT